MESATKHRKEPEGDISTDDLNKEIESLSKDVSQFPIDIFPKWIQQYLIEVCEALPCPQDFLGVFLLGTFSGIINNTRKIQIKKSWKESALLYLALISEPSTLKSPAMDMALAPIYQLQEEAREDYNTRLATYEAVKGAKKIEQEKPVRLKHFLADTTIEAAARVLNSQDRGFLYVKDELSGWIQEMNQYKGKGGSDLAFWLSNWSGKPIELTRVGLEISVANSYVPVMGAIQPDLISSLSTGKRDGFINRVLMSYPPEIQVHWTDKDISDYTKNDYVDNAVSLCHFLENNDKGGVLKISPEALEVWIKYMNELADTILREKNPMVKASLSKMKGYTARFALIIQLINYKESTSISRDSIQLAIKLTRYFIHHLRKTLKILSGEKPVKTKLEAVEKIKELGGRVTPRTIYKKMGKLGYKNTVDALKLIQELAEKGFGEITHEAPKNGGKKATFFTLFDD